MTCMGLASFARIRGRNIHPLSQFWKLLIDDVVLITPSLNLSLLEVMNDNGNFGFGEAKFDPYCNDSNIE